MNTHWYRSSWTFLTLLLYPFSLIFRFGVFIRRQLYRSAMLSSHAFSVPVIVVGNVTVGGTGKTPFVIWLVEALRKEGWQPGIVSRGYGGKRKKGTWWVTPQSNPQEVGDEAVLLAKRARCPIIVHEDRVAAVNALLSTSACNIVISDDGLQHYRLQRHIEIVMVDGQRRFGNQQLLPAGPLREPVSRLQEADYVITQGEALAGEYRMELMGDVLVSVIDAKKQVSLATFKDTQVHAVAGIGHPERFFQALRKAGLQIIEHAFPDHFSYHFASFDWDDALPIIMTEKDAVKCIPFADDRFWCLPVVAVVDELFETHLRGWKDEIQSTAC